MFPETISRQRGRFVRAALTLLLPLSLWACQSPSPVTPAEVNRPTEGVVETRTYDGSADGFTLDYPSNWTVIPKGSDGNLVAYLVRLRPDYDSATLVSVESISTPKELTSDQVCEVLRKTASATGLTPTNEEKITFAEEPGCELLSRSFLDVTRSYLYLSGAGFFIQAHYSVKLSPAERIKKDLDVMTRSFRVVK